MAGVARMQGCPVPDSDGDGINDEEDKCAAIRGVPENNGCPAISRAIEKKLAAASRNIFFATGSARLLATSAGALNTIVQILRESPDLELHVEGHTDNTGTAAGNLLLSTQRAQAVATYILKKGILPVRVSSAGSGSEKPMADNDTPQGKAKNRRVELKVHY
ncbi:MAG: OmpA family protein [Chitinophagaceae bacterium]|nr:OmpA family protein [Chitinophagaceae bacterium]